MLYRQELGHGLGRKGWRKQCMNGRLQVWRMGLLLEQAVWTPSSHDCQWKAMLARWASHSILRVCIDRYVKKMDRMFSIHLNIDDRCKTETRTNFVWWYVHHNIMLREYDGTRAENHYVTMDLSFWYICWCLRYAAYDERLVPCTSRLLLPTRCIKIVMGHVVFGNRYEQ